MKTCLYISVACLLAAVSPTTAEENEEAGVIHEAFPEIVPSGDVAQASVPLVPLSAGEEDAFQEGVNIHELARVTDADIAEADRRAEEKYGHIIPGPARVGIVRKTASVMPSVEDGSALETKMRDGKTLRTLAVRSPGAHGMRLHFTGFDVGSGSVIVYAQGAEGLIVRGPYSESGPNRNGDFWTASLPGDEVLIEVADCEEPQFEIAEIVHFDQDFDGFQEGTVASPPLLSCHLDVNCYDSSVNWAAKMATGQMNFSDADGSYVCTGTLLNDLDGETIYPYFLTARHCLNTQAMVDTLEVVWKYQTPTCNDEANVPSWASLPRNVGGTHLTSYSENDMEFMLLQGDLVGGLGLAGWTESTSSGQYGVHHPKGSWKRVVFLDSVTIGCPIVDPTDFDSYDMPDGLTQKGSSGSGAFNWSGQLAGQLKGICSATTDPDDLTCSNIGNFWSVYGEFDTTWERVDHYLTIGGTMRVGPMGGGCLIPSGTSDCPFPEIWMAVESVWADLRVKIAAGSYPELLTIDKPMTLLADGGPVTIGQ